MLFQMSKLLIFNLNDDVMTDSGKIPTKILPDDHVSQITVKVMNLGQS